MVKPLVADQSMKEFDPECERHFPLLIIKSIDPGCTRELQIEVCLTGEVVRITSTESAARDREVFEAAILNAFRAAWEDR